MYSLDVPNAKEYVHRAGDAVGLVLLTQAWSHPLFPTMKKSATKTSSTSYESKAKRLKRSTREKNGSRHDDAGGGIGTITKTIDDTFYLLDTKQLNIALEKALAIEPEVLDYGDDEDFDDEENKNKATTNNKRKGNE